MEEPDSENKLLIRRIGIARSMNSLDSEMMDPRSTIVCFNQIECISSSINGGFLDKQSIILLPSL
ncbi:hypothetical protein Pyn_14522 [Prunus yedoensis var. nudiflora]|uniref:Uncharacterized protein n=1 Tax=Prunus yedoensis var. nudiflora TaxID=2094558 RepID=A0A314XY94_PRUYE|nr:hypothetical protein Pyn_14522 [Prunus yedoensis var. nudiflora]